MVFVEGRAEAVGRGVEFVDYGDVETLEEGGVSYVSREWDILLPRGTSPTHPAAYHSPKPSSDYVSSLADEAVH